MIKRILSFLLLFNLWVVSSYATSIQLQQLATDEGLSNDFVSALFQDSYGFVWIGTEDGLNRYDGYTFKLFRFQQDGVDCMVGNSITSLAEDQKKNIWFGLRDKGVGYINRATGKLVHFQHHKENINSIPKSRNYNVYVTQKNQIWIITDTHISLFDTLHNNFINYHCFPENDENSIILSLVEESDSILLLGTTSGIVRFYTEEQLFLKEVLRLDNQLNIDLSVQNIIDLDGQLYLLDTSLGLFEWTPGGESLSTSALSVWKRENEAISFTPHIDGNIWISVGTQIHKYNVATNSTLLAKELEAGKAITALMQDKSGVLWVGTKYEGLLKLSTQNEKFNFYGDKYITEERKNELNVQSIFVENDSIVWLGTKNKGYRLFNYKTKKEIYIGDFPNEFKGDISIFSIVRESEDNLLMSTNAGLFRINSKSRQLTPYQSHLNKKLEALLKGLVVTSLIADHNDNVWIGTRDGLFRIVDNEVEAFYDYNQEHELISNHIHTLCLDADGKLLIGTASGVCYFDVATSTIRTIKSAADLCSFNNQITSIACDVSNTLWLGSYSGLYKMNRIERDSASTTTIPGFENELITSVLVDRNNRVWASSRKNISVLMPDGELRRFGKYDGLYDQIFNSGSVATSGFGEVFFGGTNGLSWVQPDSIQYNSYVPSLLLTKYRVCYKNKKCVEFDHPLNLPLTIRSQPGLKVEFEFATMDYNQPENNYFQVFLEGYDEMWSAASTSNIYTFSNLPVGRYVLKVRGSNNDFIWSTQALEIPIHIRSPLLLSKVAYLFYALVFILIVHLFIRYQIRHYRGANRILVEKIADRAKLEEQQKELAKFHKNITDSINYALRIQTAMMPSVEAMHAWLPKLFVYFRPRDLVSGDFYWMHRDNHLTYVAVADCTGHGVPGAFMSIIGIELLKSAIVSRGEKSPAQILESMSCDLENTLNSSHSASSENDTYIKDAMDISLCVVDSNRKELHFSGAMQDLYHVRNSEMQILKGDRSVIGRRENGILPKFTNQIIHLENNDIVYLFTDGFADQFGGEHSKKFMYRRFRHLLLNLHNLETDVQRKIIHSKLEEWKGYEDQVDDILVMGFKPLG